MVKAVVGEETQLQSIEDRLSQSGISCEVGLAIGKINSSQERGFVFDLIPTPANDAGEPACWIIDQNPKDDKKKGSKPKSQQSDSSSLFIDKDWIAEHARQVSRMLLGGMKVVGIYIWVNESSLKNSTTIICQAIKCVAEASPLRDINWKERLLLHNSYHPRRWTCRSCSLASSTTSSSLRPCDFKTGRLLTSLQKFRCMYNFDIRLAISRGNGSHDRSFSGILRRAISTHGEELKQAKAMIDGKLVKAEEQYVSDGLHEVEFLLPFMQDISLEACREDEVVGILVFSGCVCSFAYSNSKEPVSQAVSDIKGDIITSLHSRLDIICDEAERELESAAGCDKEGSMEMPAEGPVPQLDLLLSRKQCRLSFPRRVFVPWLADTYVCDYIQPSETLEVLKDHCVELMSMEAPTDTSLIMEPESEPTISVTIASSLWDAAFPKSSKSKPSSLAEKRETKASLGSERKSGSFNIIAALFVLFLAVSLGFVLSALRT